MATVSAPAALEKVPSYQYPAAHVAHLNETQIAALDEFKAICEERGYYQPRPQDGSRHASHDDETLLRFLRARNFEPEGAYKQFSETEDWRKENRLEDYYDVIDVEEFETTRLLYPQWTGRRDKRGIPVSQYNKVHNADAHRRKIFVFEVKSLDSKTISKYQDSLKHDKSPPLNPKSKTEPKWLRLFCLYESLTRFVLPLCSAVKSRPHPETPVSQSNNIVDISGVGLRQFWNLKTHMQDASTLATAHYPETLDRIFIIGAPSFFPTVWSWIKRWFDPITVSKIFILSQQDMLPTLSKYIDVENIPTKYGGTLDFQWRGRPNLDPAIQAELNWDVAGSNGKPPSSIPIGPIRWRELKDGSIEAIAVGKVDGKQREEPWGRTNIDIAHLHGIERHITTSTVDWSQQTTTGTSTQPTKDGDPELGRPVAGDPETPPEPAVAEAAGQPVDNEVPSASESAAVQSSVTKVPAFPLTATVATAETTSAVPAVPAVEVDSKPAATIPTVPIESAPAPAPKEGIAGLDVITEKINTLPIRTASDHPVPTLKGVASDTSNPVPASNVAEA